MCVCVCAWVCIILCIYEKRFEMVFGFQLHSWCLFKRFCTQNRRKRISKKNTLMFLYKACSHFSQVRTNVEMGSTLKTSIPIYSWRFSKTFPCLISTCMLCFLPFFGELYWLQSVLSHGMTFCRCVWKIWSIISIREKKRPYPQTHTHLWGAAS